MRLWSLHPVYLDRRGLKTLWREGLLARAVLHGNTKEYVGHPQLIRFKQHPDPLKAIDYYLEIVADEAKNRNYSFDTSKITNGHAVLPITVTTGQVNHEMEHLSSELKVRDTSRYNRLSTSRIKIHPLFKRLIGRVEQWEKVTDNLKHFPYDLDFQKTDFRTQPGLYKVGKGEQGVLMVEPYKSEILPHWRFKTPALAELSAKKIYGLFMYFKKENDFVGMDMARKFLQMGYTRSRRYANHPSGRKYEKGSDGMTPLPQAADFATNEKAQSAHIFYGYYIKAKENAEYKRKRIAWTKRYG